MADAPDHPWLDLALIIPMLTKYGGAERYFVECVRYWQHDHDITIYASEINLDLLVEHGVDPAIKCVPLTGYFEGEHSMLLNAVLLPKIWRQEIGRHDLYHTHLWPTHLIDLHPMVWFPHEPFRAVRDLRYEHHVSAEGLDIVRRMHLYPKFNYDRLVHTPLEATFEAISQMDLTATPERIVANSRYTAHYLEEVYGRPVADVVYPGVHIESPIDLPSDPNLFVTICQLWSHKRVHLLIEAIALTDGPQLIVIGSGPEQERLEILCERLGVADRVFFLSGLNNEELRLVLARACGFLYAALNEPFGIAVLEAMAAAKPVIAVRQGGYTEICHSDFAMLVPPYPKAFADKITELQEHPELVKRMGAAARQAAMSYSWERTARELEALLIDTWRTTRLAVTAADPPRERGPLVGIQYYAWYGDGFGAEHWHDNRVSGAVRDTPLLGYYGSSKEQTISVHLDVLEQMDVDVVIVNLHVDGRGINQLELIAARHMLEIAEKRGSKLQFALQISPYTDDAETLEHTVGIVKAAFATQANYFKLRGAPVLFWFWSTAADGDRALLERIVAAGAGLVNIGLSSRLPQGRDEQRLTFGLFRGFAPFSPLELARQNNWNPVWAEAYRGAEEAGMDVRVVSISPGYDDRDLLDERRAGNPYRLVPRADGETYARTMAFVEDLSPRPDLVVISTFNEYHENTHIEPSLANGTRYIDMTTAFVKRLKASSP